MTSTTNEPFLTNLNPDPMLSECLVSHVRRERERLVCCGGVVDDIVVAIALQMFPLPRREMRVGSDRATSLADPVCPLVANLCCCPSLTPPHPLTRSFSVTPALHL
jgi:hypothetical protein